MWQLTAVICCIYFISESSNINNIGARTPVLNKGSYLAADHIDLVLDLWDPLPDNSKQFWNGRLRVKQDFLACRVVGVKERECCNVSKRKGNSWNLVLQERKMTFWQMQSLLLAPLPNVSEIEKIGHSNQLNFAFHSHILHQKHEGEIGYCAQELFHLQIFWIFTLLYFTGFSI